MFPARRVGHLSHAPPQVGGEPEVAVVRPGEDSVGIRFRSSHRGHCAKRIVRVPAMGRRSDPD
jgi:hypothetical protein